MSINTPGGNEALSPQPPSGNSDGADARPGYPPAGQTEALAALASREAAANTFDLTQMDAELAALEAGAETPEQRQNRLDGFVETYFPDVVSAEARRLAVDRCSVFEDGCRELFEEPDLQLAEEDATDPELKDSMASLASNVVEIAANDEAIAAGTTERDEGLAVEVANVATIETNTENIGRARTETAVLQATADQRDAHEDDRNVTLAKEGTKNVEVNRDLATVAELDAEFERVKAANGGSTIAALRSLLDPETGLQSPEMKAIVQRAIGTAEALVGAIPGKEEAISRLLDQTGLSLEAASQAEVFAGLISAAEASSDFTAEEVEALRRVVNDHEDIDNSSDIKNALAEGRETITHADGTTETVGYDKENPLVADNLSVYPDGDLMRGTANFDGLKVPFKAPLNTPSSVLNERLNAALYTAINEAAGVTGGSNQGFEVSQGMKEIDLSDEVFEGQATREAKLGIENMTDTFDISTGLMDQRTVQQLVWGHQWLMRGKDMSGDAGYGDNDERARAETLGGRGHNGLIWTANDQLNEANFIIACQYIRARARTGASEPDIGALMAHVERVNGDMSEGHSESIA